MDHQGGVLLLLAFVNLSVVGCGNSPARQRRKPAHYHVITDSDLLPT